MCVTGCLDHLPFLIPTAMLTIDNDFCTVGGISMPDIKSLASIAFNRSKNAVCRHVPYLTGSIDLVVNLDELPSTR